MRGERGVLLLRCSIEIVIPVIGADAEEDDVAGRAAGDRGEGLIEGYNRILRAMIVEGGEAPVLLHVDAAGSASGIDVAVEDPFIVGGHT